MFNIFLSFFIIIFLLLVWLIIIRLILTFISWLLKTKFGIQLKVNYIKFFELQSVHLSMPNGFVIEIDSIRLSINFLCKKSKTTFTIFINDFRIRGYIIQVDNHFKRRVSIENKPFLVSSKSQSQSQSQSQFQSQSDYLIIKRLDFLKWLSFVSLKIANFSFNQLVISNLNLKTECLINSTIQELNFSIIKKNKTVGLNFKSSRLCAKLLKHSLDETCLAHLSLNLDISLFSEANLLNLNVNLNEFNSTLNEGLYFLFLNYQDNSVDNYNHHVHSSNFLSKLQNIPVKQLTVNIKGFLVQLICDRGQKILAIENEENRFTLSKILNSEILFKLLVINFKNTSGHHQLAFLQSFVFEAKLEEEKSIDHFIKISIRSELISFHLDYIKSEIDQWIDLILINRNHLNNTQKKFRSLKILSKFIKTNNSLIKFKICSEFRDLEFKFQPKITNQPLISTLCNGKLTSLINPDPIHRELSCEFFLASLKCYQQNDVRQLTPLSENLNQYIVSWESLLFKLNQTAESKLGLICCLQTLSLDFDIFHDLIQKLIECESFKFHSFDSNQNESSNVSYKITSIQLKASSLTAFSNNVKLFINSASYKSESVKVTTTFKQVGVYPLVSCVESSVQDFEKINEKILFFDCFKMVFDKEQNERLIILSDQVFLLWNVFFHLTVINLYTKYTTLWKLLKQKTSLISSSSASTSISTNNYLVSGKNYSITTLKISGLVNIGALLSNLGQRVFLEFSSFSFSKPSENKFTLKSDQVQLVIDNHVIGKFEQIYVLKLPENESVSILDRNNFTKFNFELKRNQACLISIENIRLVFPYKYNFAFTFHEKFITCIKWLKQYHKRSKSLENTVSFDMLVKIQSVLVEIGDDIFEVKLRDNYELMKDEFIESLKRPKILRQKIGNVTNSEIIFKDLYKSLSKKVENIYIERHKKLYASSPPRSHLFLFKAEGIELKIAADSSLSGHDKLVELLRTRLNPESPLSQEAKFVTIWGRNILGQVNSVYCKLRDFPKPLLNIKLLKISGLLLGAEKENVSRAKRQRIIDMGPDLEGIKIETSMSPLKFYHNLHLDVDTFNYTHGTCWEPVLQQLNICFESILKPSIDPSPALPWWDKMRFLFHGPLSIFSKSLSFYFHGSLDPYNDTELIEFNFVPSEKSEMLKLLTGKISIEGNLNVLVHTASKYDERCILYLPKVKISLDLKWECLGDPFDHHSVTPHAADTIPDYSIHQNWDSYRAFRSQSLKVQIYIENLKPENNEVPVIQIYSSTLKWLENQKFVFRGICRLTRRGKLFGNTKQRKIPFSRIFKEIRVTICLKKFKVFYWSSLSKQLGFEIHGGRLTHSAHHNISFVPYPGGLIRRARPVYYIACMNSEVSDVEAWFFKNDKWKMNTSLEENEQVKHYFLSFNTMSYNRASKTSNPSESSESNDDDPTHRLVIHGLKGAWTKANRDIAINIYDLYVKAEQLKRNLSNDALKPLKIEGQTNYLSASPMKIKFTNSTQSSSSPTSTLNKGFAASMLQSLIADFGSNSEFVYTDDTENKIASEKPKLTGIAACSDEDLVKRNWLIELVNSQVVLRGCETSGYVIVSASKTQIVQKLHKPVWKDRTLYSKTTLVGSVECMQYFATVDSRQLNDLDSITWLSLDNIEEKTTMTLSELSELCCREQSAGGVVSSVVGASDIDYPLNDNQQPIQLQRIISRCGCQFYYVNYSNDLDPDIVDLAPFHIEEKEVLLHEPWEKEIAVDSFTLNHHDLEICTNSQQYAMIMDLVNNLLLYGETHRKEAFERLERMRYQSILDTNESSLKEPILKMQNDLRSMVSKLKKCERNCYFKRRSHEEGIIDGSELKKLQEEILSIEDLKEKISSSNEDLTLMISVFKEFQLIADKTRERQAAAQDGESSVTASVVRRIEICFKQGHWKLTDLDGQLGLAELKLDNFIYTKVVKSDDTVEHTLELGNIIVSNSIPNEIYTIVLEPTRFKPYAPVDRHRACRIYCKEKPPQNGISVKEHFEINVAPITLGITEKFYQSMFNFFFGGDLENKNQPNSSTIEKPNRKRKRNQKEKTQNPNSNLALSSSLSSSSFSTNSLAVKSFKDDHIEKMRQRAQRNKSFVYIKIPEVPIKLSYKGKKNLSLKDFNFIFPTIEYHNQTWEWFDLIMEIKKESKHLMVPLALKHKFNFRNRASNNQKGNTQEETKVDTQEEEDVKAKLLFGNILKTNNQKIEKLSKKPYFFVSKK